jgi:hypothetical protein
MAKTGTTAGPTARIPKTTIPGVYAIMFRGFNREELGKRARHLVGVGYLNLSEVGIATLSGLHRSTNSPMTGQKSNNGLRTATYGLKGTYTVDDDGTSGLPIRLTVNVEFDEKGGNKKMQDSFAVVQCGPDQFWLVSTNPQDEETGSLEKIDELVFGEARKLTDEW